MSTSLVALPVFVPSREAVEQAAQCVARAIDPNIAWVAAPAYVKNHYARLALDVLNASGQQLVADTLAHVGQHGGAYGVPDCDALTVAADSLRERLEGDAL